MKKKIIEKPVEAESQQASTFNDDILKDLKEIKDLLSIISERILELKITGGF